MADHDNAIISESEEMYLITIARLVEQGEEAPVSISRLSGELAIQPVSANQMGKDFWTIFRIKGFNLRLGGRGLPCKS